MINRRALEAISANAVFSLDEARIVMSGVAEAFAAEELGCAQLNEIPRIVYTAYDDGWAGRSFPAAVNFIRQRQARR